MRNIIHVLPIKADPETVFQALSTIEGLKSWWTGNVEGETKREAHITFRFVKGFNPVMKVLKMKQQQVEWRCVSGARDWLDAMIDFYIIPTDEGVKLKFQQNYARLVDDDTYGVYNHNWGYYLDSLRLFCEEGTGKPYTAK